MALVPTPCACGSGGGGGSAEACCSPSITAQPLCCDDGSTILLVLRSACADCGGTGLPPEVAGWVDPATGIYTAGPAPAGCGACSTPCADTVCVLRCDDTDGDGQADATYSELWCVRGDGTTSLLLTYQDDPSTPYTPVAPVDCQQGSAQCHTQLLCDDVGPFLRRITFVSDGTATYMDVAVDGQTPHIVTGTVRACGGEPDCEQRTTPAATLGLCLADGTPIAVIVTRDCDGVTRQEGWLNLSTGAYSAGQPPAGAVACGESRSVETSGTFCDVDASGTVLGLVLIEYSYGPDGAVTGVRLIDATTGQTYMQQGEITTCPAGVAQPEQDAVILCDVQPDGTVTPLLRDYRRDENGTVTGHSDYTLGGAPYTVTGTVGICSPDSGPCGQTETLTLCDNALDGTVIPFLRHLLFDCEGQVTDSRDTTLDGSTPYAITGTVGQCTPEAEPCRNTSTLLLCDVPADGEPDPAVTDTDPTPYYPYPTGAPVAGAQTLWDGGTLDLPAGTAPQPGTVGRVNSLAATIQAPRPSCDTGTARVTVSVTALQQGPDNGCAQTGHLRLFNGTTQTALTLLPVDTPAGWFGTLTVQADVPAADLAAGTIAVALALDAYDDNPGACAPSPRRTGWQLSAFTTTVTYDQAGCAPQFLRNVTTDCTTGAITAVIDTTLDGDPYTATGEVGQCAAADGGEQPCPAHNVIEACRCDDTDGDGLPDVSYVELLAVDCAGNLTSVGTYTEDLSAPYTPVQPVDCCAGADEDAPPAYGAQARRVELAAGQTWSAAAWPTLQSVTAIAHGGTGRITTADGPSTLHAGEAATWSITRDTDARLTGPLSIAADTGTVTITYTLGVQL